MADSDRITGSYPGGPRRRGEEPDAEDRPHPKLERAQAIDMRAQERQRIAARQRRRRRVLSGFAIALVLAGGAGFWVGLQADRTSEEIAAEQSRRGSEELDLTRERNIILQQLWLMEDLERARR